MASSYERLSSQSHRPPDADKPLGYSQSWSRTAKEQAARIAHLRRRVFTTVELFEGVLHQLPSVASQLDAVEAVGIQLESTKVHELKLIESFCNFVSYRYDHDAIVPEIKGLDFEESFLQLDAFGVWMATDEEIKTKCLPYVMQTTVPRHTLWSDTYVPLKHSIDCVAAERIRVLMDHVPFIEWAGGRKTIYIYLTLCEEERSLGYSDLEWETLSRIGCEGLEHPDEFATLQEMLVEESHQLTAWHVQNLHSSSIDQPWREWLGFFWDPEDPLPPGRSPDFLHRVHLELELKEFVESIALHQREKDSRRLNGVTYMRLWIHAYATRKWADLMMFQWAAARTKLMNSDCSVHFLVARKDLSDNVFPCWAIDARIFVGRFFIHQGSWPKEVLHKGRFFSSGKLAVMDGPGV
ncbi:hypothetical protein KC333_g1655 [Hortaea werneckii]|nr:hypothetical protein KC333_g1655 [Hortaea werneckii]KAI7322323.1 hypothetical protein KC326_g1908 [Hortaea werneckii]